jgi:GNAT superfamily N-acetyltransferase
MSQCGHSADCLSCFIQSYLYVDPEFKGQGIGSKLLAFGTDQADEQGVPCWLESSVVVSRVCSRAPTPSFPCCLLLTIARCGG